MKTVKTQVSGELSESLLLFTPTLNKPQIALAEAAICRGENSEAVMVISNQGEETVRMPKGEILGTMVEAEIEESSVGGLVCSLDEESSGSGAQGDASKQESDQSMDHDRVNQLMEQLELDLKHFTPRETKQLLQLITSYADIFALDSSELGTTNLVQHAINTGDHSPI